MVDKIEETVDATKTPRLNNPETYMLTHNSFNTYLVLIFSDINKTQIFILTCRVSSHDKIEIVLSFNFLNV